MQISLKWINELVNLETENVDDLINKLTLGGFEVEDILKMELANEKIISLEISATANRSDSLSIQGLSLEIAALLNKIPKKSVYSTKICPWTHDCEHFYSKNPIQNDCSGFIAIMIENLDIFTSPKWLQKKLITSGFEINNNLSDFQNYMLIETGYPIEFYDLDKIYSKLNMSRFSLILNSATTSNQFYANNGNKYSLDKSSLILQADTLPISIAGIISANYSAFSTNSKTLLMEASIFNAAKIRQESRKLGLRTDRSSRYEKSLKNISLLESVYRFISLLRITNPKLRCKLHTIALPAPDAAKKIKLDYKKVKEVLGPVQKTKNKLEEFVSPQVITNALKRLRFDVDYDNTNLQWDITIPPLRTDDIVREIDIIEEIGRIYGFNKFLTRLPSIKQIGAEDMAYKLRKKITSCLINIGLNELIQYSLVNKETYLKNEIELLNPLVKDYSNLRLSLLPNLITALEENVKKGNTVLEGFEYGHAFSLNLSDSDQIIETEMVGGILGGTWTKSNWSDSFYQVSWFEAKGKIETFFKKLNVITYWKSSQSLKDTTIFHLYRTADLYLSNGTKIGNFGQISPIIANKLNIPTDIYLFEFNFDLIKSQIQQNKLMVYHEYSQYPKIIKDLSFIINTNISFKNIRDLLYLNGSHFLKEVNLLDEYRGKSIPKKSTSLCLQLLFQSDFETLQTETVEIIINNLLNVLTKKLNITIRL